MKPFHPYFAVPLMAIAAVVATQAYGQSADANANNVAATCVGCHGAHGEGKAPANFPRLAGQPEAYLAKQLANYANGSRANQLMTPIAKELSQQQINALAAHYAAMAAPPSKPTGTPSPGQLKRGQLLATVGDEKIGVQACANCHGPDGAGEPPTYPYLAGQHSGYLTTALGDWKAGARNTDPSQQMRVIAKHLSDSDIAALAAYYAAQAAPAPQAHRSNASMASTRRAATSNTNSRGGSAAATGSGGVEQGAATSGGSQGPAAASTGTGASSASSELKK